MHTLKSSVEPNRYQLRQMRRRFGMFIHFGISTLPYPGFWVTEGGSRSDYNCALEPSSGYYDSVSRALKNNRLWLFRPDEEKRFDISMSVQEEAK